MYEKNKSLNLNVYDTGFFKVFLIKVYLKYFGEKKIFLILKF